MKSIIIGTTLALSLACTGLEAATSHAPATASSHPSPTTAPSTQATQPAATAATTTTQRGPTTTGQPNQNCEALGNQPGNSMSAPGSAFNPNGTAGSVYAGEQPQNSRNTASVSQYDVACARKSK